MRRIAAVLQQTRNAGLEYKSYFRCYAGQTQLPNRSRKLQSQQRQGKNAEREQKNSILRTSKNHRENQQNQRLARSR
ncbi:hypothetical protein RRG08_044675 [Elysia crispata]|uniref:Uncharacterized protein n=1 Tax=Elysia crispata TaxID=231223 RepID=A0AAE0ZYK1_9GAST|nr:hypothetical protein RRG08_044675 [Elysia crispata]